MSKLSNKKSSRLASPIPLLAITLLVVSGFIIYIQGKSYSSVLGESSTETESPKMSEKPDAIETPEPTETPEPKEFESEKDVEVKDGTVEAKIKIRNGKNKFEFQQEGTKVSVESNFPLSVNPTTRELTVNTPAGSKTVAVLPQQAVTNMLSEGVVSTTSGVLLKTEANGNLNYEINGVKNEKLLGVFGITIPKDLVISAQTGQVLEVNQSVFSKILDFLSV